MIPNTRRENFLRQPVPIRLGSLAADLARVASFGEIGDDAAIESLLEESTAFIEWCAPDLVDERVDHAARLVDIQLEIASWQRLWQKASPEFGQGKLISQARAWSDEILAMSGLLDQE